MNIIGQKGEDYATLLLRLKGYKIEQRNWRFGFLEIDIIASNKTDIVFVEVKTRTSNYGGLEPEDYVDKDKKKHLITAGNAYMKMTKSNKNLRFDIIGILMDKENQKVLDAHHIENAFTPTVRTVNANSYSGVWHRRGHRYRIGK